MKALFYILLYNNTYLAGFRLLLHVHTKCLEYKHIKQQIKLVFITYTPLYSIQQSEKRRYIYCRANQE